MLPLWLIPGILQADWIKIEEECSIKKTIQHDKVLEKRKQPGLRERPGLHATHRIGLIYLPTK